MSIWTVYLQLHELLQHQQEVPRILETLDAHTDMSDVNVHLIEGLRNLHEQDGYLGGVANGMGPPGKLYKQLLDPKLH